MFKTISGDFITGVFLLLKPVASLELKGILHILLCYSKSTFYPPFQVAECDAATPNQDRAAVI